MAKAITFERELDARVASVDYGLAIPAIFSLLPIITLLVSLGLIGLIE